MQSNQTKLRKRKISEVPSDPGKRPIFVLQEKEHLIHGIAIPTPRTFLDEWRVLTKELKCHKIKINDVARQALCQVAQEMREYLSVKSQKD